jgi:hypothetical protein
MTIYIAYLHDWQFLAVDALPLALVNVYKETWMDRFGEIQDDEMAYRIH